MVCMVVGLYPIRNLHLGTAENIYHEEHEVKNTLSHGKKDFITIC